MTETSAQIKTLFENIIDDKLDADFTYELMTQAKDEIEEERDWVFLQKLDSSLSAGEGNTIETDYALPSDFRSMMKLRLGDYEWFPVPWEEQRKYRLSARRYFIDEENSMLRLCGAISGSPTIYMFYKKTTDDLDADNDPVWPARFRKYIAWRMAEMYSAGIDGDEVNFKMTPEQIKTANSIKEGMENWNTERELEAMDHSASPQENIETDMGLW